MTPPPGPPARSAGPTDREPPAAEGARIATLLLSDLVGSSALVERTGDAASARLFEKHDRLARDLLEAHGGREIDKTDGFLLLFDRPWQAVLYALDYHRALAELSQSEGVALESRVGIHLGEIVLRRNSAEDVARGAKPLEVEGLAKPTAARLMAVAGGRQTLMTQAAFDLARRSAIGSARGAENLRWLAHGSYLFKGVEEPVEVFEVGVGGVAPLAAPESSAKVTRVADEETILGWRPAPGLEIPYRPSWVVKEKLGEGGFGEVWLGEHQKTGEVRVFKFCYEAERLLSLQREITVFRLLKEELGLRDDIARILDWNLEEAPYFVEFVHVQGGTLTDWAAAQGGIAALPLADRLEIVAQVATALAAAHSVGVLHKDVKPDNVLIEDDAQGRPRAVLIDFGIGLVTDRERLAAKGIPVLGLGEPDPTRDDSAPTGTQIYTAPELLAGQPSTIQADIFALGVMLYQVVIGDFARPLAQGWERRVEDELLRDDIAALIDGSPARRIGSAAQVAERLRTLEERRAARQAEQRAVRAAERSQRRRKLLTTVAAASIVFLVIVSILAIQAIRARADAERRRGQAEQLIDFMLNDLHEGLDKIGRLDLLEGVARTSQQYFDTLSERDESPDALYKRGLTLMNVGDVLLDQGDAEAALATQRSALALFEASATRDPERADWQRGLSISRLRLGQVLLLQADTAAAREQFASALAVAEGVAARHPGEPADRFAVARALYSLGDLEAHVGDAAAAAERLRQAVAQVEELTRGAGDVDWRHWQLLLDARTLLGRMLRVSSDLEAASAELQSARTLADRLATDNPGNTTWARRLAGIHFQTGAVALARQELDAALASFQASREAYEQIAKNDPARVRWLGLVAESLRMIGEVHHQRGDPAASAAVYRVALEVMEKLVANDPTRVDWLDWQARIQHSLGESLMELNRISAALEAFRAAIGLRERVVAAAGDDAGPLNELSWNLVVLGDLYARLGDPDGARREWQRAVEIIAPVTAATDLAEYRDTHAQALLKLGRAEEARPLVEELLAGGWDDPGFLELARANRLAPAR